jgi:nitrile hydratase beta subunit
MDGIHDMGGMDGFGRVEPEPGEPVFHADWEGRVLAIMRAMVYGGGWHIDHNRYAQERLAPAVYLSASYYQRWMLSIERNLIERGYASEDEIAAGHALRSGPPLRRRLDRDAVRLGLTRADFHRAPQAPARFAVGARVRARNIHPRAHTRLPRYVRGRIGTVERCQGCHMYPDSVALDRGDDPQWLYTVVFDGCELWGPDADPRLRVSVEAFEPYLEAA